ncbi:hypothetical protein [Marinibactrum halimedae]|uniref:Uncharacterized protein n=1 Tax=Marinibactrum halimedae TaxID=1444977 RepID=A0AA37WKU7_9GAMM|nr:hypothetical protein [Marinibactrum halimedae]MCD9458076.1 hypothetical protein [Marinibactrum halimedae]GLS25009.1 hypothetical protein GCM10007877_07230 [Marinibactrum halimedae]
MLPSKTEEVTVTTYTPEGLHDYQELHKSITDDQKSHLEKGHQNVPTKVKMGEYTVSVVGSRGAEGKSETLTNLLTLDFNGASSAIGVLHAPTRPKGDSVSPQSIYEALTDPRNAANEAVAVAATEIAVSELGYGGRGAVISMMVALRVAHKLGRSKVEGLYVGQGQGSGPDLTALAGAFRENIAAFAPLGLDANTGAESDEHGRTTPKVQKVGNMSSNVLVEQLDKLIRDKAVTEEIFTTAMEEVANDSVALYGNAEDREGLRRYLAWLTRGFKEVAKGGKEWVDWREERKLNGVRVVDSQGVTAGEGTVETTKPAGTGKGTDVFVNGRAKSEEGEAARAETRERLRDVLGRHAGERAETEELIENANTAVAQALKKWHQLRDRTRNTAAELAALEQESAELQRTVADEREGEEGERLRELDRKSERLRAEIGGQATEMSAIATSAQGLYAPADEAVERMAGTKRRGSDRADETTFNDVYSANSVPNVPGARLMYHKRRKKEDLVEGESTRGYADEEARRALEAKKRAKKGG